MTYRTPLRVRFADVDAARMVYYPRLVHYLHVAMEDYFRDVVGLDYARFLSDHRLGLPTAHVEADFTTPVNYGDLLEIEVVVERLGTTSVHWAFRVFRQGENEPAATARVVTVNVDLDSRRKRPLPEWLRQRLADEAPAADTLPRLETI